MTLTRSLPHLSNDFNDLAGPGEGRKPFGLSHFLGFSPMSAKRVHFGRVDYIMPYAAQFVKRLFLLLLFVLQPTPPF